jgi:hypothetical protein
MIIEKQPGWRSGKTTTDKRKLVSELERLEYVLKSYGETHGQIGMLMRKLIKYLANTDEVASARLQSAWDKILKEQSTRNQKQPLGSNITRRAS